MGSEHTILLGLDRLRVAAVSAPMVICLSASCSTNDALEGLAYILSQFEHSVERGVNIRCFVA